MNGSRNKQNLEAGFDDDDSQTDPNYFAKSDDDKDYIAISVPDVPNLLATPSCVQTKAAMGGTSPHIAWNICHRIATNVIKNFKKSDFIHMSKL